ncbi:MAG: hypothetical protein PHG82_02215 [Candidatus Gracilibacteria bacterium]|nr:hypothetical protein [Candidatus Gracilibacteria bacterium]
MNFTTDLLINLGVAIFMILLVGTLMNGGKFRKIFSKKKNKVNYLEAKKEIEDYNKTYNSLTLLQRFGITFSIALLTFILPFVFIFALFVLFIYLSDLLGNQNRLLFYFIFSSIFSLIHYYYWPKDESTINSHKGYILFLYLFWRLLFFIFLITGIPALMVYAYLYFYG